MRNSASHWVYFSVIMILMMPTLLHAVPANTLIQNTVTVDYTINGNNYSENSNTVSFYVDEIIAFALTANNPAGVLIQSPFSDAPLSFTLSNQGNGSEKFILSFGQSVTDNFDATNVRIYLDSNNNQIFDNLIDTLYSPGINDPVLASGVFKNIFLVSDITAGINAGDEAKLTLTVNSATGTGAAGTIYPNDGDGGVDAVMGFQGGSLTVENRYVVTSAVANIVKSQVINDPFGGANPIQDAEITYTLALNVTGTGTLSNVVVGDVIPAGTVYKPGSLRLNGAPLTDAIDLDSGVFTGTAINVGFAAIPSPATHLVEFTVRIL